MLDKYRFPHGGEIAVDVNVARPTVGAQRRDVQEMSEGSSAGRGSPASGDRGASFRTASTTRVPQLRAVDGQEVGAALYSALTDIFGGDVWFDEVGIKPGISQSRQVDKGLASARSGIALLTTPAYLADRFWTEREFGALLHKPMLIPVLTT